MSILSWLQCDDLKPVSKAAENYFNEVEKRKQRDAEVIAALKAKLDIAVEALQYIDFASHGCPVVINGKDVPDEWQNEIRRNLRIPGDEARKALALITNA